MHHNGPNEPFNVPINNATSIPHKILSWISSGKFWIFKIQKRYSHFFTFPFFRHGWSRHRRLCRGFCNGHSCSGGPVEHLLALFVVVPLVQQAWAELVLGQLGGRVELLGTSWTPSVSTPLVLVLGSVTARDPLQWCHFLREFFSCLSSQLLVLILPFLTTRWFLPWPSVNWSSWTCSGCGNSHHIRQAS